MTTKDVDSNGNSSLIDLFINSLAFLGFDRAVGYGVLARIWGVFAGPVTMIIVAALFSSAQQWYYYTFGSLLTLQTFFELGLLYIIAQFVSHEFVNLTWGKRGKLEGDPIARERFIDFLCKSVRWFGFASLAMMAILIPAGLWFFGADRGSAADFSWRLPWILGVAGTAVNLFITPFYAFIMGSGEVLTVNRRDFVGAIAGSLISWLIMGVGGGLYAVFAVNFGNFTVSLFYLCREKPELLKVAWHGIARRDNRSGSTRGISWKEEVWPIQWRMAVSSGASYFILQLFNPVLFHYHGPVVAGQMGMTLAAANSLLGIATTVLIARSPKFARFVALRDWSSLDRLFRTVLRQSMALATLGGIGGWLLIWQLQQHYEIGQRFIPASHAALLLGAVWAHTAVTGIGVYLRAHKREPLMLITIASSLLQGTATWYLGMRYSTLGAASGYFVIFLFFILPSFVVIWRRCRASWHKPLQEGYD